MSKIAKKVLTYFMDSPLLIWNGADGLEKMANAMTADALSPFTIRVLKNNYISLFHSLTYENSCLRMYPQKSEGRFLPFVIYEYICHNF